MDSVTLAIKREKVVRGKNHGAYQSGDKNKAIMICKFKNKSEESHNNRRDHIQ